MCEFEVIFIDDCSDDNTPELLKEEIASEKNILIIEIHEG